MITANGQIPATAYKTGVSARPAPRPPKRVDPGSTICGDMGEIRLCSSGFPVYAQEWRPDRGHGYPEIATPHTSCDR
jgi:hypothetical protein